jgi:hypothetical protein
VRESLLNRGTNSIHCRSSGIYPLAIMGHLNQKDRFDMIPQSRQHGSAFFNLQLNWIRESRRRIHQSADKEKTLHFRSY